MAHIFLPSIDVVSKLPKGIDLLILGLVNSENASVLVGGLSNDKANNELLNFAISLGAKPKTSSVTLLPNPSGSHTIVVGLGDYENNPEDLRKAVGNAIKKAAELPSDKGLKLAISLDIHKDSALQAALEGAVLGSYEYAKPAQKQTVKIQKISLLANNVNKSIVNKAEIIANAVCQAREWVNTPPNLLYPQSFAEAAKQHLAKTKVSVEILDEKALAKGGYGGILAVGNGSARKPRLVRMSYAPRGAKKHLALVGKGITFDSGGLDIKPADGMYTMKCDMAGAAAVIAAIKAIAELGLKIKVTGYASMAENMPSGEAYRPSDVLTMYGGKTVENANTDAEGRLVMADALARAGEDNPDLIVDIATLTGACMIALGNRTAGLMASDDETAQMLLAATKTSGEAFWHLPITQDIKDGLDSKVADIRSSGTTRYGGALTAGAFLWRFVPEDIPWGHLDIAGPAFNEGSGFDYVAPGGTGYGVRSLIALAEKMSS